MRDRQQEIAVLAYELYLNRGCLDGYELIDWLEAEQIIAAKHLMIGGLMEGDASHMAGTALPDAGKVGEHATVSAQAVPKKTVTEKAAAAEGVLKKTSVKKAAAKKAAPKRNKS